MSTNRLDTLKAYLNEDPDSPFLLFAIAKEYENEDQLDQALAYYLQLQEKDPEYMGLFYHLAGLYEKINEQRLALAVYEKGIALAKKIGDFHALSELNNAKTNLEITLGN